jgi:hypothetical protein
LVGEEGGDEYEFSMTVIVSSVVESGADDVDVVEEA